MNEGDTFSPSFTFFFQETRITADELIAKPATKAIVRHTILFGQLNQSLAVSSRLTPDARRLPVADDAVVLGPKLLKVVHCTLLTAVIVLGESMTVASGLGSVMILGGVIIAGSRIPYNRHPKPKQI